MYNKMTATYKFVDGEMVQDGYFVYSEGATTALAWISLNNIELVWNKG